VQAAGGVLWRPAADGGVEVAVVHRPRYDDWSLPKGKLRSGEHPLLAALREVREETGSGAVAGRGLGRSDYRVLQAGHEVPKTVRWWALAARQGAFRPSDEVDELRWLTPADAEGLLTAGRDVGPLRLLAQEGLGTSTVLLVRCGRAGEEADRPLDARGRAQAEELVGLLPAWGPVRVLAAPQRRCRETVAPYAAAAGLTVEVDPVWDRATPRREAAARLRALAPEPRPGGAPVPGTSGGAGARAAGGPGAGAGAGAVVVCATGTVVRRLVEALATGAGLDPGRVSAGRGELWALTLLGGRLVDATPPG